MRKLLLFCLTINVVSSLESQNTHSAQHGFYQMIPTNMVSINSKSYYMETSSGSYLIGIDNNGQNLFKTQLPGNNWKKVAAKLVRTNTNKLLTITHLVGGCDVLGMYGTIITRCDTLGAVDFSLSLQQKITDITQHPDGSYYLSYIEGPLGNPNNGPKILHLSAAGASLAPITTGFGAINSIFALQNGNLLANGIENGVLKNVELTTAGTSVNDQSTSFTITGFKMSANGILYGLAKNGSIQSYSSSLTPLNNSSTATLPNIKLTDFNLRNDSIFCTGYDSITRYPYYGLLGSNLNLLYQTVSPYKRMLPTGISINNMNRLSIVTSGNSNANTLIKNFGLYQTSITGSLVSKQDVGVVGYYVLSSNFLGMNFMIFQYMASLNLAVQVRNFGTDTITSFYLNHEGPIQCLSPYHEKFTTTIYPNSVVTVTTGVFNTNLSYGATSPTGPIYTTNACISSSAPNAENDRETDNDSWCEYLYFGPIGLIETMPDDKSIRVFPNPVQNYFSLEADHAITKVEITTATGELIFTEFTDKPGLRIETDHWSNGIYFVKIKTEKGYSVKKVIKD